VVVVDVVVMVVVVGGAVVVVVVGATVAVVLVVEVAVVVVEGLVVVVVDVVVAVGSGVTATQRQSVLQANPSGQPALPSHSSPSGVSTTPSCPQRGAVNPAGRDLAFFSVPVSVWQRSTMVPFRRTLPGTPHAPAAQVARSVVPRLVAFRRTRTAGQPPRITTWGGEPARSSTSDTLAPAKSGGSLAGTRNRPVVQSGGFGVRADAMATSKPQAATAASQAASPLHRVQPGSCRIPQLLGAPSAIQSRILAMSAADSAGPPSGIIENPQDVPVSFFTRTLVSGDPGTTSGAPVHGGSVLFPFVSAAYSPPLLRSSIEPGDAPWQPICWAQRAGKIGCTSRAKLTVSPGSVVVVVVGIDDTHRQSKHTRPASHPTAPSHVSPPAPSTTPSPQLGAVKDTGAALLVFTAPRSVPQPGTISPFSFTFAGMPHSFFFQVHTTLVPAFVPFGCTRFGGQPPTSATVKRGVAPSIAMVSVATVEPVIRLAVSWATKWPVQGGNLADRAGPLELNIAPHASTRTRGETILTR